MKDSAGLEEAKFKLLGLGCASCTSALAERLRKTEGIQRAGVDLFAGEATVGFDPSKTSPREILKAIREAGLRAFETKGRLP